MSNITPAFVIEKKRNGDVLSDSEIQGFIQGITSGEIPDYQATALLMAIFFKGMTLDETVSLTRAMLESGDRFDLSGIPGVKIDKHSTGGVGDKVSLILAPLAVACGLKVPMMAGRGLGHSGGTIDKLEAIPGFNTALSPEEFKRILKDVGTAIIGQTSKIAPADKKLYALRDVTATVPCVPLIVGSILSKKLAEGTEGLILDVKVGNGAFMQNLGAARKLAKTLVQVAKKLGLNCRAALTQMDQPLGCAVGNTLEVIESIAVLRNEKPFDSSCIDLKELTIHLCAQMLEMGRIVKKHQDGRKLALAKLQDGSAWEVFRQMVKAQGGLVSSIDDPSQLPISKRIVEWKSSKKGYIKSINTKAIGELLIEMGGGRKVTSQKIDFGTGFVFKKKVGSSVSPKETLVITYLPENISDGKVKELEAQFFRSIVISAGRHAAPKLILDAGIK
ncbi:MAG: thymidine phosphorylase [Xanthomonadaceae bacterium]|nr:thymidine phosphorylase [Xanthomonadaceae bacterium]